MATFNDRKTRLDQKRRVLIDELIVILPKMTEMLAEGHEDDTSQPVP